MRSNTRRGTARLGIWIARGLLASVAVVALTSCDESGEPPVDRCERARNHFVELHVATNPEHAEVIRGAMGPEFVENCSRSMSEQHTNCIIEARTATAAVACATTKEAGAQ